MKTQCKLTKEEMLLQHLKSGQPITSDQALELFKINSSFSFYICRLRKNGYNIQARNVKGPIFEYYMSDGTYVKPPVKYKKKFKVKFTPQAEQVLCYLHEHRCATSIELRNLLNIKRASSVIFTLKQLGYNIINERAVKDSHWYVIYRLENQ